LKRPADDHALKRNPRRGNVEFEDGTVREEERKAWIEHPDMSHERGATACSCRDPLVPRAGKPCEACTAVLSLLVTSGAMALSVKTADDGPA